MMVHEKKEIFSLLESFDVYVYFLKGVMELTHTQLTFFVKTGGILIFLIEIWEG